MQDALEKLGIQATPADEASVRAYVERRLVAVIGGRRSAGKILSNSEVEKELAKIESEHGITLADVHMGMDENHHVKLYLSDKARDALIQKYNIGGFSHSIYHGTDDDKMVAILSGSIRGLVPTNVRWLDGIGTSGISSSSDMANSGADYIFTHIKHGKSSTASGTSIAMMHPKAAMRRLDYFANSGDSYGKYTTASAPLKLFSGDPHETLFKHGIPLSDLWYVSVYGNHRDSIIERLKKQGITSINGIPIENFIITDGHAVPDLPEYRWSSNDLPPAITI